MRTGEERILAMHQRAAQLEYEKRSRTARLAGTAAVAVCLALTILMASVMPSVTGAVNYGSAPAGMNASLFAGSPVLGYIVIAIAAFLLGAAVTVFCFRLKKWRDENPGEDRGVRKDGK